MYDPMKVINTLRPVFAETGNHLLSVKKVQDKQVSAAAVDSTAYYNYKNVLHRDSDDICVLDSIGPLPPYAIVCNKNLNGKQQITGQSFDCVKDTDCLKCVAQIRFKV